MNRRLLPLFGLIACGRGFAQTPLREPPVPVTPKPIRVGGAPASARAVTAQTPASHVSSVNADVTWLQELVSKLAPKRLRQVTPRSWEEQVLMSGQRAIAMIVRLPWEQFSVRELYTQQTEKGDVLVARWSSKATGRREKAIWLWDSPKETVMILEVDPSVLNVTAFSGYCEGLFRWNSGPLVLKALKLAYIQKDAGRERVSGHGEHEWTATESYYMAMGAVARKGKGHVGILVSKPVVRHAYPPEDYQVSERFPPLRERLVRSSRQALFEELEKGYGTQRDAIVIGELLSRQRLTEEEFRQVLFPRPEGDRSKYVSVVDSRLMLLLDVIKRCREMGMYVGHLENAFLHKHAGAVAQGRMIARIFGAMTGSGIDPTPTALKFLEHGVAPSTCLYNLERYGRGSDIFRRISQAVIPLDVEPVRQAALSGIAKRATLGQ
jgi:hypothetical protein